MRLWSLHPKYLDVKGLTALWREGLLAQKVLQGSTRGYRHHPQLLRFKAQPDPASAVAAYLVHVHAESIRRGYHFDESKVQRVRAADLIPVDREQVEEEWELLKAKLQVRDPRRYLDLVEVSEPEVHPLFVVV